MTDGYAAVGALVRAHLFGCGANLLGAQIEKVRGPIGIGGFKIGLLRLGAIWRYDKQHEAALIWRAEAEMAMEPVS